MLDLHDLKQIKVRTCVNENRFLGFEVLPIINSKRYRNDIYLKNLASCSGLQSARALHLLYYSLLGYHGQ